MITETEFMERSQLAIWRGAMVMVAVGLTVNAVQAMMGKAEFAWWHLPSLVVTWIMGDCGSWVRRLRAVARLLRMRWRGYTAQTRIRTRG